jgi:hypothetical protein
MIKIKDFAFNPLKGGAFSITATITPEMVEEFGGKMAVMQKMIPLMGSEFVTVTNDGTRADVLPQDETNARILEMLQGIQAFIDTKSQAELPLKTDEGDAAGNNEVCRCYNTECDFHSGFSFCTDDPPFSCELLMPEPIGS